MYFTKILFVNCCSCKSKGHSDPAFTLPELYDDLQRKVNSSFSGIIYGKENEWEGGRNGRERNSCFCPSWPLKTFLCFSSRINNWKVKSVKVLFFFCGPKFYGPGAGSCTMSFMFAGLLWNTLSVPIPQGIKSSASLHLLFMQKYNSVASSFTQNGLGK